MLVVDDSTLPRVAARAMLGASDELSLCGEASSGREALEIFERLNPDLVLMDVQMPDMDGATTTRTLLSRFPGTKVIAWTVSVDSDDLVRMIQAGCSGYVLKDVGPTELKHALTAAIRSESPLPRRMMPDVLRRIAVQSPVSNPPTGRVSLTPREGQVLKGIAKGYSTKRMATDLGLSAPSINTYLRNLFRKLGVTNRGEAVSTALKLGVITLADL